jgi:hypothetical protein
MMKNGPLKSNKGDDSNNWCGKTKQASLMMFSYSVGCNT